MLAGKRRIKHWWQHRLLLTALLLAILLLIVPKLWEKQRQRSRIEEEIDQLKSEIATAENKNTELKQMIGYLESPEFSEEQARLNFNLKKPGEEVVVIKDTPTTSFDLGSLAQASGQPLGPQLPGNYQKWFDYFFKPKNK